MWQTYLLMSLSVEGGPSPLPLQSERRDQALNLGSLAVGLAILALKSASVGVDILAHIIILGQVEELPDFRRSLGTTHARLVIISESGQVPRACRNQYETLSVLCALMTESRVAAAEPMFQYRSFSFAGCICQQSALCLLVMHKSALTGPRTRVCVPM